MKLNRLHVTLAGVLFGAGFTLPQTVRAHCDTMDGPVVMAAKAALEKKDVTPVLQWVKPDAEPEIRSAFAKTLAVRAKDAEARELADQFFFETLVRVHRAGEGAPYTGLKPAGTKVDPAVEAADQALDSDKADTLIKTMTDEAATGIRRRFAEASEKKKHAEHNVEAGREYVAAYVEFVHYVEALHTVAARPASAHDHGEAAAPPTKAAHEHNH